MSLKHGGVLIGSAGVTSQHVRACVNERSVWVVCSSKCDMGTVGIVYD